MGETLRHTVAVQQGVEPESYIANAVNIVLRRLMRAHGCKNRFEVTVDPVPPYEDLDVFAIRVKVVD